MALAVRTRPTRLAPVDTPFTLPHFRAWAQTIILDTGNPWILEDFQARFIEDVFKGFPECWLIVPEANTKTTTMAGLVLYHSQHRATAYAPLAAASREQAEIAYRQAEGFVIRTPWMKDIFECQPGYRRILGPMGSRIQVIAADDRTGDGTIPTICGVDELHRHRDLKLYRTLRGKLDKRQAQIICISTSGEPGSEFEETRERIRQEGAVTKRTKTFLRVVSDSVVLHEWAVPEGGDTNDLKLVKKANPFSGITLALLERKKKSATMTDGYWRRMVCNRPTRSERAAIHEAEWHGAISPEAIPEGKPVWVGLAVAWKWNTTAAVPLWIRDKDYRLLGPARVLVPPRDGTSLDPNLVERALIEIHERNPIHTVVMNISRAEHVATWIREELGARVVDNPQSAPLSALDYESFMEALRNGWLKHAGDKDLTRHALNAIARMLPSGRAHFERPSRTVDGGDQDTRVIDAVVSAAMVHTSCAAEFTAPRIVPLVAVR